MSLSRLENFLKSSRGKILHVNPENLDASDSITNDGSTPFTPFKTLNRAALEAARYSYQIGLENDRFNFCTIVLYSGEHFVDNRPGLAIQDNGTAYLRNGSTTTLSQFDLTTVLDITDPANKLFLLNSAYGGLIIPRGTSIVASDLRKTTIRPLYVPDPRNGNIERSAIFRVTGAAFLYGFTVGDADPNGFCYKNYNTEKFTPNFSHHKLTAFEYADGVNPVKINDTFLNLTTTRTDLQQYYEKVSLVYGESSGKEIDSVSYVGGVSVDIQPVIDEYRIVGPRGEQIGITSIRSGNGVTPTEVITATLDSPAEGISVDTAIQVSGVNQDGYDGQFIVSAILSDNEVQYKTPNKPLVALPFIFGASLSIISDTTASSSPYVNKVSLKSSYGLCGIHADGSKVEGFRSFVAADFTGISLQKDNEAFVLYDETSGTYVDSTVVANLYKNTKTKYKPAYQNYHIRLSNEAFAQLVSVFSIGYAAQIITESGSDCSLSSSNSNFGAKSFVSSGFKNSAFRQDNYGFIVGVIPPQETLGDTISVEFPRINVGVTTIASAGAATTTRLYFHNATSLDSPPKHFKGGYKIGAKLDEKIFIDYPSTTSSKVVVPGTNSSYEKSFVVQRQNNDTENSILNGIFTLTSAHTFEAGEKVRVISNNAYLPDGVIEGSIYYIINSTIDISLTSTQVKLAVTLNNALNNVAILPNKKGGTLTISSKVYDKVPNEPGHPIQWDSASNNWFINVSSTDNKIYDLIKNASYNLTGKTYITRTPDNRSEENKLYKFLYCIPKNTAASARPPVNGFIIQESGNSSLSGTEFNRYFGGIDLSSETDLRNPKFISNATWGASVATFTTELPHKLKVADSVEIFNVSPSGYNGVYVVASTPTSRTFTVSLSSDPGLFTNNTTTRNSDLPYVKRKKTNNVFQIYKSKEVKKYIQNKQDGLYELTVVHSSVKPTIAPFTDYSFSQPLQHLYPQLERDNSNTNPIQTQCFAEHNLIGNVIVNDKKNSVTRESFNKLSSDLSIGIGITGVISNLAGTAHTLYTDVDHGLSVITSVSIVSAGSSYLAGTYYGVGVTTTSGGESASFKIAVDVGGIVTSAEIMSGGSNYAVGNLLSVVSGIGTTTGFVPAVLSVTNAQNPVNNSITLYSSSDNLVYQDTFTISSIPSSRRINITSNSAVSGVSTTLLSKNYFATVNNKILDISTLTYNNTTGISVVTTTQPHGALKNNKVRLVGFTSAIYNSDVVVTKVNSLTQLEVYTGISTSSPATTGTGKLINIGISPAAGLDRLQYYYTGITTTAGATLSQTASDSTPFNITNANTIGLRQGDYIQVNSEVMRIKSPVTSNLVSVYRSQLGTNRETHLVNSIVRKINVAPVELRRNSIARSSGQTFEYVGYGAGNYSTSFPENQDRDIEDKEKILSQSLKSLGGTVYYAGMDENGDFYSGKKKVSSTTGEEKLYDVPTPAVAGEAESKELANLIETDTLVVSNSLRVDGGENDDIISVINSPLVINNKLTSHSDEGIEVSSLLLKGSQNVSRNYTIADSTPASSGNYGDVIFRATPQNGVNLGWVYTTNDEWKTWGYVGETGTQLYIYSGTESGPSTQEGIVDKIKFVGDPDGFGITVDIDVDASAGFATVVLRNPSEVINFGTGLGLNAPTFTTRSPGTRIVYYNYLSSNDSDYAVGVSTGQLWWSIPRGTPQFTYKWFGGVSELMSLNGNGILTVSGGVVGNLTGTASVATTASNLNRSVIAGVGLTGGGELTTNRTLSVQLNGGSSGLAVDSNGISVDSTVLRTTGNKNISGVTTFTSGVFLDSVTNFNAGVNINASNHSWKFNTREEDGTLRLLYSQDNLVQINPNYISAFELDAEGNLELNPLGIIPFTGPTGGNLSIWSTITGKNGLKLSATNGRITSTDILNYEFSGGAVVKIAGGGRLGVEASSIRFKQNVEDADYESCENIVLNSRAVYYQPKFDDENPYATYFGFIAEEVAEVDEKLVIWDYSDPEDVKPLSVSYSRYVVPLVKVVQEQHQKIKNLEEELENIKDILRSANLI